MKRISSQTLAESYGTKLCNETFQFQDGSTTARTVVRRPDACAVLVVEQDNQGNEFAWMVRQAREAVDESSLLEIAAGKIDPGETPDQAAKRELVEEMGFQGDLEFVKTIYPSPGYTAEHIYVYVAVNPQVKTKDGLVDLQDLNHDQDLRSQVVQDLDHDENIDLVRIPVKKAIQQTRDAKSLVALLYRQQNL